jgi:hypothetical protein
MAPCDRYCVNPTQCSRLTRAGPRSNDPPLMTSLSSSELRHLRALSQSRGYKMDLFRALSTSTHRTPHNSTAQESSNRLRNKQCLTPAAKISAPKPRRASLLTRANPPSTRLKRASPTPWIVLPAKRSQILRRALHSRRLIRASEKRTEHSLTMLRYDTIELLTTLG